MILSPAQVRFIVGVDLFDDAIRRALAVVDGFAPLFWHLRLAKQRNRSRLVTRRKQRSKW